MITAVNTNVLLDVFGADPKFGEISAEALRNCLKTGALVACEVVWAETAIAFPNSGEFARAIGDLSVGFDPINQEAALKAADAWRRYRASGDRRTRIAADFLIGAHALNSADRLLTRDRGFYREYFARLKVLDPSQP